MIFNQRTSLIAGIILSLRSTFFCTQNPKSAADKDSGYTNYLIHEKSQP
jgi:hypothetical protein